MTIFSPFHARYAVVLLQADISRECRAVVEGEAEILRLLEGEPVAVGGVFAEVQALVQVLGVHEVNCKVLTLAINVADRWFLILGSELRNKLIGG